MSCKWAIPGKLDWQCGINRTLCYGARLFAQLDVKGVSSSRQQDGGHGNIQMRSLKTEVEKGSIGIVIIYGLVDPKR